MRRRTAAGSGRLTGCWRAGGGAGKALAQRPSTRGYPQVNLNADDGTRQTREVHADDGGVRGPVTPGRQVRHWNDIPTDNRWAPGGEANCGPGRPGNLVYGTPKQQWDDKLRNVPAPLATRRHWSRRVTDYLASRLGRRSR